MRSVLLACAGLLMASSLAIAQAPPMDMSWAIQNQMRLQQQGNAAARYAFWACYNYIRQLRARGYMGPVNCGANQQSLENSINGLNHAMQDYNHAQELNSQRQYNAVRDYDLRAIRGCTWVPNPYGYGGRYYCP